MVGKPSSSPTVARYFVACLPGTGHVGVSAQGTNAAALAQSRHQLRHRAGIWAPSLLVGRNVDAIGDAELSFSNVSHAGRILDRVEVNESW